MTEYFYIGDKHDTAHTDEQSSVDNFDSTQGSTKQSLFSVIGRDTIPKAQWTDTPTHRIPMAVTTETTMLQADDWDCDDCDKQTRWITQKAEQPNILE